MKKWACICLVVLICLRFGWSVYSIKQENKAISLGSKSVAQSEDTEGDRAKGESASYRKVQVPSLRSQKESIDSSVNSFLDISGEIYSLLDGSLTGAVVEALRGDGKCIGRAVSEEFGRYRVRVERVSEVAGLLVSLGGYRASYVSWKKLLDGERNGQVGGKLEGVDIVLEKGTSMSILAIRADGTPIPEQIVRFVNPKNPWAKEIIGRTDMGGIVEFEGLPNISSFEALFEVGGVRDWYKAPIDVSPPHFVVVKIPSVCAVKVVFNEGRLESPLKLKVTSPYNDNFGDRSRVDYVFVRRGTGTIANLRLGQVIDLGLVVTGKSTMPLKGNYVVRALNDTIYFELPENKVPTYLGSKHGRPCKIKVLDSRGEPVLVEELRIRGIRRIGCFSLANGTYIGIDLTGSIEWVHAGKQAEMRFLLPKSLTMPLKLDWSNLFESDVKFGTEVDGVLMGETRLELSSLELRESMVSFKGFDSEGKPVHLDGLLVTDETGCERDVTIIFGDPTNVILKEGVYHYKARAFGLSWEYGKFTLESGMPVTIAIEFRKHGALVGAAALDNNPRLYAFAADANEKSPHLRFSAIPDALGKFVFQRLPEGAYRLVGTNRGADGSNHYYVLGRAVVAGDSVTDIGILGVPNLNCLKSEMGAGSRRWVEIISGGETVFVGNLGNGDRVYAKSWDVPGVLIRSTDAPLAVYPAWDFASVINAAEPDCDKIQIGD